MKPLVIGLGNRWRGDDGIGAQVIDQLRKVNLTGVDLRDCPGDNMDLINSWQDRDITYVVDACRDPKLVDGTLLTIENACTDNSRLAQLRHPTSSHVLDLQQAIALSQVLDKAPQQLTVFAIAASSFQTGTGPQPVVQAAGTRLAEQLAMLLTSPQAGE